MGDAAPLDAEGLDALPVGAAIGGYSIRRMIGHGGFGITYEAHNRVTGKGVAIKEFFPSSMVRRDGQSRLIYSRINEETISWALRKFEETTTTLCGLSHPNIVQVHDYVPLNDTGYMIMELLDGQTLRDWLKARPAPPNLDDLRPIAEPVMEALCYVHGKGLIHRDIAPDNILITHEGRPVLIDFGSVSRDLSDAKQKALSGTVGLTKRYYTAPEQMRAKARPTPEADIYSMGAVLYRALSGTEPADGQERVDALFHGNEPDPFQPLMARLPAGCPARAAQAIDTALAVRPEGRIHTMAGLREDVCAVPPPALIVPPHPTPVPTPFGKWLVVGAVAIALIVVGVLAGKLTSDRTQSGVAEQTAIDRTDQQARDRATAADRQRDADRNRQQADLEQREAQFRQSQANFQQQQQALAQQQADIQRQRQQDADQRQQAEQDREAAQQAQQAEQQREAAQQAQQSEQERQAEQQRQRDAQSADNDQRIAPSFPCAQARLPVENAICADPLLARLDNQMAALYQAKKARLGGSALAEFKSISKRWLQNRNTRCDVSSAQDMRVCLLDAYAQQIEYLKS